MARFIRKSGAEGADKLEILDYMEEHSVSRTEAEKLFEKMKTEGSFFEPRAGRWRLVRE